MLLRLTKPSTLDNGQQGWNKTDNCLQLLQFLFGYIKLAIDQGQINFTLLLSSMVERGS